MENKYHRYTPDEWMQARPDKRFMAHYVTYYPNMLPVSVCESLMKNFDQHPELQVLQDQGGDKFRFMQTNVTTNADKEPWKSLHSIVVSALTKGVAFYKQDTKFETVDTLPPNFAFEHVRINRTANNGKDGFGHHMDVGDYASARRFVTLLFYLNDIEEGGDAAFPHLGMSMKPTQGSLLVFPSPWMFVHCGLKPISHPKYIMTSFCHYL